MKKIKLLLAAMTAMVASGLYAQTDAEYATANAEIQANGVYKIYTLSNGTTTGDTKYYLKTDGYLTDDASAAGQFTFDFQRIFGGFKMGGYRINKFTNGGAQDNSFSGDALKKIITTGQNRADWEAQVFFKNEDGYAVRSTNAKSSNWGASAFWTVIADNDEDGLPNATYTVNDVPYVWQLEKVTDGDWSDVTAKYINNYNPVANADGWTATNGNRLYDWSSNPITFDSGNNCAEMWSNQNASIKQTLQNLPAGYYELTAIAFTREGMTSTLYAGESQMPIATVASSTVDNRSQANTWFNNGNGSNALKFAVTQDNTNVEIGLITGTSGDAWTVWRAFYLTYTDKVPDADIAALVATIPTNIPTAVKDNLNSLASTLQSEKSLVAYSNLQTAIGEANGLTANYNRYQSIKNAAKAIASSLDTTTADSEVEGATTNAAIDAAIVTLRAAFLAELPNLTIPTDPGYIDVTSVMVDNAGVRTNTDYWTKEGTPNGNNSFGKCAYNECEFYGANFKFYQTLALTPGTWEFGVTGFHRAGNHKTNFYAGDDKILIPGVESSVVNTMAEAETYFDNGNGKVALKFLIETAGDVEIGINNQDTETDKWTIFRDFTLKYYGAPDYSVYETQWTDAVTAANAAKNDAANANVTGSELTDLNAAIADSPVGSNLKATYIAKIQALQNATQAFIAAAPSYDKYVAYKAESEGAWGTDFNVAAPTTAAEALAAVQNMNIAQYNKVASEYTYSLNGLIGDFGSWTGTATYGTDKTASTPNYLSNEHWSGQDHAYYEQCSEGWGNAGGWTIKYEKTCTLPAGDYVIKVAARTAGTGVTSSVSCTATATTITLPAESAYARGIKKNGEAGWSGENSEYARDGVGYGWQWRFLPFTLAEQGEVTMTFYAEASSQYQWMSIADGELLSARDVATPVNYADDANNTIEKTLVANVTINRTIKVGYNTVCLPFTLTANQVKAAFGTGAEVYEYSENSADANSVAINFTKGDGSITANVPVLVKATAASDSQTFNGVQIVAAAEAKVEGTNLDYVGVYAPIVLEEGDFFLATKGDVQNVFQSKGNNDKVKGFRAYFQKKTNADVKAFMYIEGDDATGILTIDNEQLTIDNEIYNLAGQRMSKMQKGINIVNGKKVLF